MQAIETKFFGPTNLRGSRIKAECAAGTVTFDWNPEVLKSELKEYGAWDDAELSDHYQNIQRMIWIACADVSEDPDLYIVK